MELFRVEIQLLLNYFSTPRTHFLRFLKQIFGYTALHYTREDRLHFQLSTCMVCLSVYVNTTTRSLNLYV
jgi:hypothetical protein